MRFSESDMYVINSQEIISVVFYFSTTRSDQKWAIETVIKNTMMYDIVESSFRNSSFVFH